MRCLLLGLLILAGACQAPGPRDRATLHAGSLPADLAILLPENRIAGAAEAPLVELRIAAAEVLVDRGYSPLADDFVDSQAAMARSASKTRVPESGVVAIEVLAWRDRDVAERGRLFSQLAAKVYDATGRLVADLQKTGTFSLDPAEFQTLAPSERGAELRRRAVAQLLDSLPAPPPL